MSTIPAKTIERSRNKLCWRNQVRAPLANHACDGEAVRCFSLGEDP